MFSDLNLGPAFEDLSNEYMDLLKPLFEPFSCYAGAIVLQQGAPADYLYLILRNKLAGLAGRPWLEAKNILPPHWQLRSLKQSAFIGMNCESYTQNNPKQVKWFWNAWQMMFPLDGKMLTRR